MKFPYTQFHDYYMPVIPVALNRGDRWIVTEALVDSGPASCVFDVQFAAALGIEDLTAGRKLDFEGVTGHGLSGYEHEILLTIGGNRFATSIAFSEGMPDGAENILGQLGFFELCPIHFTYAKKEIEIVTAASR